MPKDRKLKKRKKRQEKRKALKEQTLRAKRLEKALPFLLAFHEALEQKDPEAALQAALEGIRQAGALPELVDRAISIASFLGEEEVLYRLIKNHLRLLSIINLRDALFFCVEASRRGEREIGASLARAVHEGRIIPVTDSESPTQAIELFEEFLSLAKPLEDRSRKPQRPQAPRNSPKPQAAQEKRRGKAPPEPGVQLELRFDFQIDPLLEAVRDKRASSPEDLALAVEAYQHSFRSSFDQLLCLPTLKNVRSLWYQEETARRVMKTLRGRAILADEVGLGKTIEAGLVLKEYVLRGLVRTALILTPSALVAQWREEMEEKFGLQFVTTNDAEFRKDPDSFWRKPFIIASINVAKRGRNFLQITSRPFDMVIVDEAHHLKNRNTQNWRLVDNIKRDFLLLLTATPVENNLEELYNLVTLLKPGHLRTRSEFRAEFMKSGDPTDPKNREKLRTLLKEVMVRNTRSVAKVTLPPRYATTTRITPTEEERAFYHDVSKLVTEFSTGRCPPRLKLALRRVLANAGSSPAAATTLLQKIAASADGAFRARAVEVLRFGETLRATAKSNALLDLLAALKDQAIVFVNSLVTLRYLHRLFEERGVHHAVFQGSLSKEKKQEALELFRRGCPVLLSSGSGGEGHNLQFCNVVVNYDLPWNPMEIEQRIGRVHRIGQEKEVYVYNFCTQESVEDYILNVLDRKLNMFELVVGEMDMVLGRLRGEQEFDQLVYELWVQNPDPRKRLEAFESLGERLRRARMAYEKSKELDEKLFRDDFGV